MHFNLRLPSAFLIFLLSFWFSLNGTAAPPVPFSDAYEDGYVFVNWNKALTHEQISTLLDRVAKTRGKHLTVPVFGCQSTIHSSDVGSCSVRSPVDPIEIAKIALSKGLKVSLLPIVVTPQWDWRGFFVPHDIAEWFRTYTLWIKELARHSRELGMSELIVASEFTQLYKHTQHWKKLLSDVRQEFFGPLIITVNWGDTEQGFWEQADAIGVSAYYPLSKRENPTDSELTASWIKLRNELVALSKRWKRPLHITEIGYPSVAHAARTPWANPDAESVMDWALQARCFDAFRKAWENERALARASIWATEDPALPQAAFNFEPLGKPAEQILDRFFQNRLQLIPPSSFL